ncbi:hypothetical protein [Saccharopolyspora griseoalba]|uniref:Uncharacterized protein n=1 Tax=Saccharopolyspora griseoalba TaxID=1431848 RepID=A0ABW2LSQ5_9PSEU
MVVDFPAENPAASGEFLTTAGSGSCADTPLVIFRRKTTTQARSVFCYGGRKRTPRPGLAHRAWSGPVNPQRHLIVTPYNMAMRDHLLILRWLPGVGWGDLSLVTASGRRRILRLVCLDPGEEPDMVDLTRRGVTSVGSGGACETWFLGSLADCRQPAG